MRAREVSPSTHPRHPQPTPTVWPGHLARGRDQGWARARCGLRSSSMRHTPGRRAGGGSSHVGRTRGGPDTPFTRPPLPALRARGAHVPALQRHVLLQHADAARLASDRGLTRLTPRIAAEPLPTLRTPSLKHSVREPRRVPVVRRRDVVTRLAPLALNHRVAAPQDLDRGQETVSRNAGEQGNGYSPIVPRDFVRL
jgi:hypothetical protein